MGPSSCQWQCHFSAVASSPMKLRFPFLFDFFPFRELHEYANRPTPDEKSSIAFIFNSSQQQKISLYFMTTEIIFSVVFLFFSYWRSHDNNKRKNSFLLVHSAFIKAREIFLHLEFMVVEGFLVLITCKYFHMKGGLDMKRENKSWDKNRNTMLTTSWAERVWDCFPILLT